MGFELPPSQVKLNEAISQGQSFLVVDISAR